MHASETVEYINNSPDSLKFIYFHLWPNAYSGNKTALAQQLQTWEGRTKLFNDPSLRGYIDSLDFKINDEPVHWSNYNGNVDVCVIQLNHPLAPGDTIIISTPFHVKIPGGNISRLGHTGRSYQISQWFPKPAVYDNNGWHPLVYLDQGEFYSEFGDFHVSITLPHDYTVCASGEIVSGEEDGKSQSFSGSSSFSNTMKTIVYERNQIHDFAWFADKNYFTMRGKIVLPSGKVISTKAVFTSRNAYSWTYAPEFINDAISSLSEWIGDYPYESFTAVEGSLGAGAGMEYPGLAVIGSADDAYSLDEVLVHEACHSWFYSSIASDERRYPFMDEGITTAYELRYMNNKYPDKKLWEVYLNNYKIARLFNLDQIPVEKMAELQWLIGERNNTSQAADLTSKDYTETNYNNIIYYKTGQVFTYLRDYLGNELFDKIMHDYYKEWKSAHPQPADLRRVFETNTGMDLSWFFDDIIGTTRRFDYSILRIKDSQVLVRNKGELSSPFPLSGLINDSVVFNKWSEGFAGKEWISLPNEGFTELKINPNHIIPEINYLNNNMKTEGLFRKSAPLKLHFLYVFDDPAERTFIIIPLINWNRVDGFMPGAALTNGFLLPKPIEFLFMPFYSFRNEYLTGKGRVALNTIPYDKFFRKATFFIDGSLFGAPENRKFHFLRTGLNLYVRNKNMNFSPDHVFFGRYINASDLSLLKSEVNRNRNFWQAGYTLNREIAINPYSLTTMLETGFDYRKSTLEIRYRYSYAGRGKGLNLRIFSGVMLKENSRYPIYSLAPSGRSGRELYLFQGDFPDRYGVSQSGFWSRQMLVNEGGLVSPVNDSIGYSKWLISASMTGNLPWRASKLPIRPFINMLYNGNSVKRYDPFLFEAGLSAGLQDIFEFQIPIIVSGNIKGINNQVRERIRFIFSLETLYNTRLR